MVKKAPAKKQQQVEEEEKVPQLVESVPATAKKAVEAPVLAPQDPPKPVELSRKTPAGTPINVGMPKSKKPWKVLSERSSKHRDVNPNKTWAQRMNEKAKLKAVRDRVREEKERKKEARRVIAERLRQKKERKEINTMKST